MGKTLAQQAIEQSLMEEASETARTGRPRTLAQQAQDQEGRALMRERQYECETCQDDPTVCASIPGLRHCEQAMRSKL